MSGACTFIVTYRVMERKLFVSVTLLPPVLKHDAKIIPRASIQLSKKGRDLGLSKNLTVGAGFWNTENDKQPVGSCTIELPEPDLQIIDVKLTLGYQAKFDAGGAVPNPPHTVHTFILNSASRRII
ncbi:hypothetical protein BSR56_11235 [Acinetobacter haemolyticus]|nr:hypothetical protein BSR56_11235 [Acinetobacter haemolyticus]